jgi:hypothetical protein
MGGKKNDIVEKSNDFLSVLSSCKIYLKLFLKSYCSMLPKMMVLAQM